MSGFDLIASLLTATAIFAWLNQRFLRLPSNIGLLVMRLCTSLLLTGIESFIPSTPVYNALETTIRQIDFRKAVMDGMLAFLLFAGALHVDLGRLHSRAMFKRERRNDKPPGDQLREADRPSGALRIYPLIWIASAQVRAQPLFATIGGVEAGAAVERAIACVASVDSAVRPIVAHAVGDQRTDQADGDSCAWIEIIVVRAVPPMTSAPVVAAPMMMMTMMMTTPVVIFVVDDSYEGSGRDGCGSRRNRTRVYGSGQDHKSQSCHTALHSIIDHGFSFSNAHFSP